MGFFRRLKTGWALSMDSLQVLREHPRLAIFPLIAGIAGVVYVGLLLGGSFLLVGANGSAVTYVALFLTYLGSAFIAAFFSAALVHSAREAFEGRTPTVGGGLAAAWSHKGPLFAWAVISAVVGVILRTIEGQDNVVARIAAAIFSVAWSVLTYFVIPVIVFENVSVSGMFRRSGETFKNTWGETAGAEFGVGLVTVGFTLVGLLLSVVVFVVFGGSALGFVGGLAVAVVTLLVMYLVGSALGAIAKTALYVYATEGERPSQFENVDFGGMGR